MNFAFNSFLTKLIKIYSMQQFSHLFTSRNKQNAEEDKPKFQRSKSDQPGNNASNQNYSNQRFQGYNRQCSEPLDISGTKPKTNTSCSDIVAIESFQVGKIVYPDEQKGEIFKLDFGTKTY